MESDTTIKSRWVLLDNKRTTMLDRARKCAELTIPYLLPPEGHNENDPLTTPYQSLGARCVNNLASKLLLTLLPPNSPFFKLSIPDSLITELTQQLGEQGFKTQVEYKMGQIERSIASYIEQNGIRVPFFKALKLLISTGNALCYLPSEGGMRVFRFDQYVVQRDPMGNVVEIVVKEEVSPKVLSKDIQDIIEKLPGDVDSRPDDAIKTVELYTKIQLEEDNWTVEQEVAGTAIPESKGTYTKDNFPWMPLRWSESEGDNYGRGYVEEYLGDFISLEDLSKALVEGASASARVLFLVDPNGTTDIRDLVRADNGGFVSGKIDNVEALQVQKFNDFKVAYEQASKLETRLSYAFLLNSSVQRQAERVTAEEIRFVASELEDALGGIYSLLTQEFQLPMVKRVMSQMSSHSELPKFPKGMVKPIITTGLEALGRGHDLNKLQTFLGAIQPMAQEVLPYINVGDLITRIGTSLGIDMQGLIKTEQEVQQATQQNQMMQMAQGAAPGVASEATKGIVQHALAAQQQQPQ